MPAGRLFNIGDVPDFPLQLADPAFDPSAGSGYNMRDTNFVLEKIASAQKAGFLDTLDLLKKNDRTHTIDSFFEAIERPTLVTGEVFLYPEQPESFMLMDTILGLLAKSQQQGLGPRRVIMPISMAYSPDSTAGKGNHGMVLLMEEHPDRAGDYRIALLEQHARYDGDTYDYGREKEEVLRHVRQYYPKAEIIQNRDPFCTQKRVCGIVSLGVCKRLLSSASSFEMARDAKNFAMDAAAVAREHEENVRLAQRKITAHGAASGRDDL